MSYGLNSETTHAPRRTQTQLPAWGFFSAIFRVVKWLIDRP